MDDDELIHRRLDKLEASLARVEAMIREVQAGLVASRDEFPGGGKPTLVGDQPLSLGSMFRKIGDPQ